MYQRRPVKQLGEGRPSRYPYGEVLGTLGNGQAYYYRTRTPGRCVEAMRRKLRGDGYRLGRERIKGGVLLWVEQRSV